MKEKSKKELKEAIEHMVRLLLGETGKARVEFSEIEDCLTCVIKPEDKASLSLLISKNGSGINALRRLATLGAKRRQLKVYVSIYELEVHREDAIAG